MRTLKEVAGTMLTCQLALDYDLAVNTAGGTHHAFRDSGSGFSIFNDIAIATEHLLRQKRVKKALIFDRDVYQGSSCLYWILVLLMAFQLLHWSEDADITTLARRHCLLLKAAVETHSRR